MYLQAAADSEKLSETSVIHLLGITPTPTY
jgi:hypothetical protein